VRWLLLFAGCGFSAVHNPDLSGSDLAGVDGGGGATNCLTLPLPCLDPADVLDVPSEMTLQNALAQAKAGDTIQVRGLMIGSGFRVPSQVTLHGCENAQIVGTIAFDGQLGTIEGFEVSGTIVANRTGTYTIRANKITGSSTMAGISALANEGIVSADVKLTVEGNWFQDRPLGLEAITEYDTLTHSITLTARNNIFWGLMDSISLDEAGIVGKINADLAFNTFQSGGTAVRLIDVDQMVTVRASTVNLGAYVVDSNTPYSVSDLYYFGTMPTPPNKSPPASGKMINADPQFVDWTNGDFHLKPESELRGKVTMDIPADDYYGCARANPTDVGAIQN
jgi:hypothetical protein